MNKTVTYMYFPVLLHGFKTLSSNIQYRNVVGLVPVYLFYWVTMLYIIF